MKHIFKLQHLLVCVFIISSTMGVFSQNEKNTKNTKSDPNIPIFEVKNDLGQTVFAVYPGGVKIFIDDQQLKAAGGGFTVGRIGTEKAAGDNFLIVNPGDVRINIQDTTLKAAGGGFTVGRIGTEKAVGGDFFTVRENNVRVILNDTTSGLKAAGGGFTVGRIGTEKAGGEENFLTVTPDSTRVYIDSSSTKGFAVGKIGSTSGLQNFMYLKKDNYFIGHNSGEKTTGLYNLFLGYESGLSNTSGESNTFLGFHAGYENTTGVNNVFLGKEAGLSNNSGSDNVFLGTQAGSDNIAGYNNVYLGYLSGTSASGGIYNTFIGSNSGENTTTGDGNVFIGYTTGQFNTTGGWNTFVGYRVSAYKTVGTENVMMGVMAGLKNETGSNNTFLGSRAGRDFLSGDDNTFVGYHSGYGSWSTGNGNRNTVLGSYAGNSLTDGDGNVFIGYQTGYSEDGSNKLYIDNSSTTTPLIYGDFTSNILQFNGGVGINGSPNSTYALELNLDGNDTYALVAFGNTWCSTGAWAGSDIRFKKNVITYSNALEKILQLRGVTYEWNTKKFPEKGFTEGKTIGLIAQEMELVIPELVNNGPEGYKSVSYDKLTAVLIEAVKEQQKQIEELKEKNSNLSLKVSELNQEKVSELDQMKAEITELKAFMKGIVGPKEKSNSELAE